MQPLAVLMASLSLTGIGDWATASAAGTTLSLRLHYEMICGQPGPGPLVVRLPAAARLRGLRVLVRGAEQAASATAAAVTIQLPRPPQVTCMSITEGVLPVELRGVRIPPGAYTLNAQVGSHRFTVPLRV
jgi:hypothetical protein